MASMIGGQDETVYIVPHMISISTRNLDQEKETRIVTLGGFSDTVDCIFVGCHRGLFFVWETVFL